MQIGAIHHLPAGYARQAGRQGACCDEDGKTAAAQQAEGVKNGHEAHENPSSSEYRELQELKARDREVRQHEQAHIAAAGQYAQGGATFSYQKGPDGRNYAVGGEVQIDTSEVRGDPQATIRKMEVVQRAATAPAEPSGQDRAVAAQAAQAAAQARVELQREQFEGGQGGRARQAAESYRANQSTEQALSVLIDVQA